MFVDPELLRWFEKEHYITFRQDPHSFLRIAKYTPKAVYQDGFREYDLLKDCRGLIVTPEGKVWAKPFRKFFRVGEYPGTDMDTLFQYGEPEVSHKRDGSAIVLFTDPETSRTRCATLGSFTSDIAHTAQELWDSLQVLRRDPIPYDSRITTWVLEYTSPENQIVVQYAQPELTLVGSITTATGYERSYAQVRQEGQTYGIPTVYLEHRSDITSLVGEAKDNFEGYVLFWPDKQLRLKVKLREYSTLHRIRTETSTIALWEVLSSGGALEAFDNPHLPESFRQWVQDNTTLLAHQHRAIVQDVHDTYHAIPSGLSRKDFALAVRDHPHKFALFLLYDGKSVEEVVWKSLRPRYENHFKKGMDEE